MAGPVSITCPLCRQAFPVPTEVLGVDGHQVIVRMDRSELHGHLESCAANEPEQAEQPAERQAEGSTSKALERPGPPSPAYMPAFVAKGRRSCTMCGTVNAECMQALQDNGLPCCPSCGEGDTHPAPGDR